MLSPERAVELLEKFLSGKPGYPGEEDSFTQTRKLRAIGKHFAALAVNEAHAQRMIDCLIVARFLNADTIETAASTTRLHNTEGVDDTSWEPITDAELHSPELLELATILKCKPEEVWGPAGSKPTPALGFYGGRKR